MSPSFVRLRVFRTALQREKWLLPWLENNPDWSFDKSLWEVRHPENGIILLFIITKSNMRKVVLPPYDEVEYMYPAVEEVRYYLRKVRTRDKLPRWGINHW